MRLAFLVTGIFWPVFAAYSQTPSTIETLSDSRDVKLADGNLVKLGPRSRLALGEDGSITIEKGSARVKATKTGVAIRTPSAQLNAGQTDFQILVNPASKRTSVVSFQGTVRLSGSNETVEIGPGRFSTFAPEDKFPLIPVKVSPSQVHALQEGGSARKEIKSKLAAMTPIPPGINPALIAIPADQTLKKMNDASGGSFRTSLPARPEPPPEGIVDGSGRMAPPAGGFVDLESGLYVSPPAGSAFDALAQVYLPPATAGGFDPATGNYRPVKGEKAVVQRVTAGMTAAPVAPGTDPGKTLAQEGAAPTPLPTEADAIERPTAYTKAAIPPAKIPTFNPNLCPPYCNPLGAPGTKSGSHQPTAVSLDVQ